MGLAGGLVVGAEPASDAWPGVLADPRQPRARLRAAAAMRATVERRSLGYNSLHGTILTEVGRLTSLHLL